MEFMALTGYLLAGVAVVAWWLERGYRLRLASHLHVEARRLPELLEGWRVGHWQRDIEQDTLWWSREFRRMHGIDDDTPADRAVLLAHIHPDDRDKTLDALLAAYQSGHGEIRYRSLLQGGQIRHHLVRVTVTDSAEGRRTAYGFNLELTAEVMLQEQLAERTAYLEAIVKQMPMGLSVFDHHLKLRFWNDRFSDILNLPRSLVKDGTDFADIVRVPALRGEYGEGEVESLVAAHRHQALRFEAHRFERTRPNGRTHLVIEEPIQRAGEVIGFVTTYTDITQQNREREAFQHTSEVLRTLIENIPAGVSMIDSELRLVAWNQKLLEVLDLPAELFKGAEVRLSDLFDFNIQRGEYGSVDHPETLLQTLMERAQRFEPHAIQRVRPNGQVLSIVGRPLSSGGFVTIYNDITEQQRQAVEIQRLAHTDSLTGMANRGAFIAGLQHALASAQRRGSLLAVLFIDMDAFKAVNDTLGHATGDHILRTIAQRLKARVRRSDLVGRMGGDEFVVALCDIAHTDDVHTAVHELIHILSAPYPTERGDLYLSPSIGVAQSPQDAVEADELIRLADLAMYHAKRDGGAGFSLYTPAMNDAVMQRLDFERRLREAIQQDGLELHYQPIHALPGCELVGFEALLRWPKPGGGYIPPDQFIPLAEASDLIKLLGHWVCHAVARQRQSWQQSQPDTSMHHWRISINLSPRQFEQPALASEIAHCFAEAGQTLEYITFEITEGVMMGNPERAQSQLLTLRRMGAQCAVDDFGTGHSSLSYLRQLAIDSLKIDRSFIQALGPEPDSQAIVAASIGLAHQLGRKTVAEGVETQEQLAWLQTLGCDAVQGYLFSRPMPADQVPIYRARWSTAGAHPAINATA